MMELLEKYLNNQCSDKEKAIIEKWYLSINKDSKEFDERFILNDLADLHGRLAKITTKSFNYARLIKLSAAAILLLGAFVGLWFLSNRDNTDLIKIAEQIDVAPGINRATLLIEGEDPIELKENESGLISKGKSISYVDGTPIKSTTDIHMATLKTPIAGQYKVELPDGTKLWLNAQSSVRYPTEFSGNTREIYITGEVFLEVTKNPKKPFIVRTKDQLIEVLGTSFNIDSYADNGKVYVSLNEGKLKVTNEKFKKHVLLSPGQQAILSDKEVIDVKDINADELSSWKDGLYIVNDEYLAICLRKIERWYGVKFAGQQRIKNTKVSAIIPRDAELSEVLKSIELRTNVKFKIEGRSVQVW